MAVNIEQYLGSNSEALKHIPRVEEAKSATTTIQTGVLLTRSVQIPVHSSSGSGSSKKKNLNIQSNPDPLKKVPFRCVPSQPTRGAS